MLTLVALLGGCVSFTPAPSCDAGPACPAWTCECGVGFAEGRDCRSGRCAEAAAVCRAACADAGTCWQGRATDGWPNGNSVGTTLCTGSPSGCGDANFADLGKPCASVSDCASGLCLGSNASFICVKSCTATSQCPPGWVCGVNSHGGSTCFIGAPGDVGAIVSTNVSCKQVAFTDIGATCRQGPDCQSRICFGSTAKGFFCSRRCNDDSLCATGFKCVTSNGDSARFCEKQ